MDGGARKEGEKKGGGGGLSSLGTTFKRGGNNLERFFGSETKRVERSCINSCRESGSDRIWRA